MWFGFVFLIDLDWTLTSMLSTWPSDDSGFFIENIVKEYGSNVSSISSSKNLSEVCHKYVP
uniref:Secreted protein n=1 Tax=Heterorhabditis bacteriophora TaxID=37862 RepID=A0A1I7XVM6_HETBA